MPVVNKVRPEPTLRQVLREARLKKLESSSSAEGVFQRAFAASGVQLFDLDYGERDGKPTAEFGYVTWEMDPEAKVIRQYWDHKHNKEPERVMPYKDDKDLEAILVDEFQAMEDTVKGGLPKSEAMDKDAISKDDFQAYVKVQMSGDYNMIVDAQDAMDDAGLDEGTYFTIIKNYGYLKKKFEA